MNKYRANIQSEMTQKLIYFLSELETTDRSRMSTVGRKCLDNIWKLLGQPTYKEMIIAKEKVLHNFEEEE
ncbi:hypothetical protein [Marinobacter sp.]|jgi:hypothetical protein|uniref:hypothetical protein n=1 Tax=Marinobacter sp. TaxID=50741 RepID=UPI0023520E8D|nr:hypothetical protein [Marinobacter sp.]|tara:strand:+ start:2260 stop:2469 length:210 start_codon:yes stop_codon:yes gene_type:complete